MWHSSALEQFTFARNARGAFVPRRNVQLMRATRDPRRWRGRIFSMNSTMWKLLAALILLGFSASFLLAEQVSRGVPPYPESARKEVAVSARAGETCVVCDREVSDSDLAYEVNGQRVPVHRGACDATFHAHAEQVLAKLQPRGAFLGSGPRTTLSSAWFWVGVFVLLGLIFAALCSQRALAHGHPPYLWFFAGFFLNIVGYVLLRMQARRTVEAPAGVPRGLRKIASTYAPEPCPHCGALNHPAARSCSACGKLLAPRVLSEVARVRANR